MEFASRSRPTTTAADDEENDCLRRFPDHPPSQPQGHGEPNTSGVDAALLARRQKLLLELLKGSIQQGLILRELVETEHAMGFIAGSHNPVPALPQDFLRCWTPSMSTLEAHLRQPCPCGCGNSMAVRAPPVNPHLERSSHAPEQTRPGNDAEQHQEDRSSGVRTHPFNGHFKLCHSPSKQTPVPGKAGVNQMRPSSGHQQAIVWEKIGVEVVHNMQPLNEIKNHSSEGQKAVDSAIEVCVKKPIQQRLQYKPVDQENAANNEHAPEQTRQGNDAEHHQEGRSSGVRTHPFNGYFELCRSPSKQIPLAGKAGINQVRPLSGHQQGVVWEKIGVEVVHNMQPLHEIKNPSSEGRKAIDSGIEDCVKKPMHHRLQYKPVDQENAASNDQKSTEFNEPTAEGTSAGVKRKLTTPSSPVKKQKPLGQWSCTICQANPASQRQLEQHLAGKRHQSNVAALQPSQSNSSSPEPDTKATPARSRIIATNAQQDGKQDVPENRWTCTLCRAKCYTELNYYSHLGGLWHREKAQARREEHLRFYCSVCDLQCNSEKMLESHLGGRRHRETLEARD
ncbi:uncharacterized protein LOC100502443 [Zea mays]|uniref:C2H2-type domain-containing protein n=2 Tax=Zea mays TaxID=4577 RepID=C4JBJ4_MAIZE|nr:uncharacterized protein LOC100502443 [Zea mays]ACR38544.1 unknown [Zea mays]ONM55054.1 hypothetical protein ZEAMMB73_Zm00001d020526 [Zea mays]|eukprot:NP_001183850.1 uncharacterized protein LOC100502443 [Zea mays]